MSAGPMRLGYFLSCEEYSPGQLLEQAKAAEQAGFEGGRVLLPRVRARPSSVMVLADGFSCRTQIEEFVPGTSPLHLAQVLADGLD